MAKKKKEKHEKTEHSQETQKGKKMNLFQKNPFIAPVLALAALAMGLGIGFALFGAQNCPEPTGEEPLECGPAEGQTISPEDLSAKVKNFLENSDQIFMETSLAENDMSIEINNAQEEGDYYKVSFSLIEGGEEQTELDVFTSKDGKYIYFAEPLSLSELIETEATPTPTPVEAEKAEKPSADLHIFSYCPAGSSALDSFAPVGKLLAEKADLKVRFFSHMHGEYEKQQNMAMECMQKEYPVKFWDYADLFLEEVYTVCTEEDKSECADENGQMDYDCYMGKMAECDKEKATALMEKTGIDSNAVYACVEEEGEALYKADQEEATNYALQYSPSLVANGTSYGAQFDRSAEGIKSLVCGLFIEAPEECGEELNTEAQGSGAC